MSFYGSLTVEKLKEEKAKVEAIDTLEAADSNKKDNIIYSDAKVEILEEDAKD